MWEVFVAKKPNAIVLDTNVLVHDPNAIQYFMKDNKVFLPTTVIVELDNLKNKIDIGQDASSAIRQIEQIELDKKSPLTITKTPSFKDLDHLDSNINDHKIIATAYELHKNNNKKFKKVKMVSKDIVVRILTRDLGLMAEDYFKDQTDVDGLQKGLPRINVSSALINDDLTFPCPKDCEVVQNGGVVCVSDWDGIGEEAQSNCEYGENFAAIRKDNVFKIIPADIEVFGIRPIAINGDGPNWEQYVAIYQLLDPSIKLVFLHGSTGSGKTLLALAAALEQRKKFRQILITRPLIHLEDEDRLGFLPGDLDSKLSPSMRPIWRVLNHLGSTHEKMNLINVLKESHKIDAEPLDFIRGLTFIKDILVVDEAQNLTPHQVKTIITRSGQKAKIIFTGDLQQIDRKRKLDKRSSGLTYAITRLKGQSIVANSYFSRTVRSELADLGDKLL